MKYGGRTDKNQDEIVSHLRNRGALVLITSSFGNGFPDLIVAVNGNVCFVEVKTKTGKLRSSQVKWFYENTQISRGVARGIDDADKIYELLSKESPFIFTFGLTLD